MVKYVIVFLGCRYRYQSADFQCCFRQKMSLVCQCYYNPKSPCLTHLITMCYTCSGEGCKSNVSNSNENVHVFEFLADEGNSKRWIKFAAWTRKTWTKTPSPRICIIHFEPKCIRTGRDHAKNRLIESLKPGPIIRYLVVTTFVNIKITNHM